MNFMIANSFFVVCSGCRQLPSARSANLLFLPITFKTPTIGCKGVQRRLLVSRTRRSLRPIPMWEPVPTATAEQPILLQLLTMEPKGLAMDACARIASRKPPLSRLSCSADASMNVYT